MFRSQNKRKNYAQVHNHWMGFWSAIDLFFFNDSTKCTNDRPAYNRTCYFCSLGRASWTERAVDGLTRPSKPITIPATKPSNALDSKALTAIATVGISGQGAISLFCKTIRCNISTLRADSKRSTTSCIATNNGLRIDQVLTGRALKCFIHGADYSRRQTNHP